MMRRCSWSLRISSWRQEAAGAGAADIGKDGAAGDATAGATNYNPSAT